MFAEFEVFKRRAWKKNSEWPNGYEPDPTARRTHVCYVGTRDEARAICRPENDKRPESGKGHYEFVFHEFDSV